MSDRDDDPAEQLKQGLGLLFRAARGAASGVRKEMDRSKLGRSIDDAGRELVRAATNVVSRIGSELQKSVPPHERPRHDEPGVPGDRPSDEARAPEHRDERARDDAPKGPTREDPGFRIAVDDEPPKDREPR
jgi:hypothetical protein